MTAQKWSLLCPTRKTSPGSLVLWVCKTEKKKKTDLPKLGPIGHLWSHGASGRAQQSSHADRYSFINHLGGYVNGQTLSVSDDYGVTRTEYRIFFSRARRRSWHHDRGWLFLGASEFDPQSTCRVLPTFYQVNMSSTVAQLYVLPVPGWIV